MEDGGWRMEDGGWRMEDGGRWSVVGGSAVKEMGKGRREEPERLSLGDSIAVHWRAAPAVQRHL